jgi:site-specific DNA-methyltransferase (adenine-specific)
MKPTLTIRNAVIYQGNNLEVLPTLPDNSVDSIVCDPPYELGFMGKSWDSSGIAYSVELWRECLRVLKPGGHLLAFGGTRTWHRLAVAIEDAGFEIRDNIAWLYGSGFPKSHNISKAIDKAAGAEREVTATIADRWAGKGNVYARASEANNDSVEVTASATDDAKAWDGWGTALKPAHEPIVVARKPLTGTVAQNVLEHGVGGINVDACRIGFTDTETDNRIGTDFISNNGDASNNANDNQVPNKHYVQMYKSEGRWPANIILDEYTAELLDQQSGISKSLSHNRPHDTKWGFGVGNDNSKEYDYETGRTGYSDVGGASRFFYVAKANKRDRNEGLNKLPEVRHSDRNATDGVGGDNPRNRTNQPKQNFHPTVKPTALMQYLIRLVTPNNGVVLDPFAGSGSTGKAAILENKHFIGIEVTPEYLPIIEGRLTHAYETLDSKEDLF